MEGLGWAKVNGKWHFYIEGGYSMCGNGEKLNDINISFEKGNNTKSKYCKLCKKIIKTCIIKD